MSVDNIIRLIQKNGCIKVSKDLSHAIGKDEAIFYCELLSKCKYFENKKQLDEEGFFFYAIKDMQEETTLSEYQQQRIIKNLKKLGLIEVKAKGSPPKRFFKINHTQKAKNFAFL